MSLPTIITGGVHVDARGAVRYVNGFNLGAADRFYIIAPARACEWRGWAGHCRDRKWFFAVTGESIICIAPVADLERGGALTVYRVRLSEQDSRLLEVPPGFATAIQVPGLPASLLVLSTGRIEEASDDMLRFPIGDPSQWIIEPLEQQ